MDLAARVRRFVARHRLAGSGTRVAVAVSGGSDSVALAHLLRELSRRRVLAIAGIVHFNHQLRETASRDEQAVVALADDFGWPIVVDREDVAARRLRDRQSIEAAARAARHLFYERARAALGADVVALGHTKDDQAETFLLRLVRGAGPKGLAAMHPRRGCLVRPVLCCRRAELRGYLGARGIPFVEDESNEDVSIPRNRIRAELLPLLERRFNPRIVDVLAREAEIAREIWDWIEEESRAFEAGGESADRRAPAELDLDRLAGAPAALRRVLVWKALVRAAAGREVAFDHVESVLEKIDGGSALPIDLPGGRLVRRGRRAAIDPARGGPSAGDANFFERALSIPGEVALPEAGCVVSGEWAAGGLAPGLLPAAPDVAVVRADRGDVQFRVRNRRPGDCFRPLGLGGRKKLQDFFVDRKVPREARDRVPIVVDARGRIVWVAGHAIDEAFRVTSPADPVVILRLKLLGGAA